MGQCLKVRVQEGKIMGFELNPRVLPSTTSSHGDVVVVVGEVS
jgi:hypothetical protein